MYELKNTLFYDRKRRLTYIFPFAECDKQIKHVSL